ncbi:MAG: hypothetical protein AAB400_01615 [Patescibacteria group bacterium]
MNTNSDESTQDLVKTMSMLDVMEKCDRQRFIGEINAGCLWMIRTDNITRFEVFGHLFLPWIVGAAVIALGLFGAMQFGLNQYFPIIAVSFSIGTFIVGILNWFQFKKLKVAKGYGRVAWHSTLSKTADIRVANSDQPTHSNDSKTRDVYWSIPLDPNGKGEIYVFNGVSTISHRLLVGTIKPCRDSRYIQITSRYNGKKVVSPPISIESLTGLFDLCRLEMSFIQNWGDILEKLASSALTAEAQKNESEAKVASLNNQLALARKDLQASMEQRDRFTDVISHLAVEHLHTLVIGLIDQTGAVETAHDDIEAALVMEEQTASQRRDIESKMSELRDQLRNLDDQKAASERDLLDNQSRTREAQQTLESHVDRYVRSSLNILEVFGQDMDRSAQEIHFICQNTLTKVLSQDDQRRAVFTEWIAKADEYLATKQLTTS